MLNLLLTCKSWTSGLDTHLLLSFGLIIHSGLPFQKISLFTSHTSSFYCSLFTLILAVVYTSYPNPGVVIKSVAAMQTQFNAMWLLPNQKP